MSFIGDYTALHEIGHIFGGMHPEVTYATMQGVNTSIESDSRGYLSNSDDWQTIMGAYSVGCGFSTTLPITACARLPLWSNPTKSYSGQTRGVTYTSDTQSPLSADMASALEVQMPIVAAFESYPYSAPATPGSIDHEVCGSQNVVHWTASTNAENYQVLQSFSSSFTNPEVIYFGDNLGILVRTYGSTVKYVKVRACNGSGCGSFSSQETLSYNGGGLDMIRKLFVILALLALTAEPLIAQEGPYVPCVGCDDLTQVPYPEPGLWYNPDQSGTGFTLEFQNGVMAGHYFGYDTEGEPEWYLVTNKLERSETAGVMWELELEPQRYSGGNCMTCPYQSPGAPVMLDPIKIEFLQRAYARITLSDDSVQYMVPIIHGDNTKDFFAEQTPYRFPLLTPTPYSSLWTLVFKPPSEGEYEPWNWFSGVYIISTARYLTNNESQEVLEYPVLQLGAPPEVARAFGRINCQLDAVFSEPNCIFRVSDFDPVNPVEFQIPIGNLTDSRIFGETEDGGIVEGFRLDYD